MVQVFVCDGQFMIGYHEPQTNYCEKGDSSFRTCSAKDTNANCNRQSCRYLLPSDDSDVMRHFYYYYYFFFKPRKNEGGKKLRKVGRGLKWKTSPGGPQREKRRAAIRH